jgi:hypothetical protein
MFVHRFVDDVVVYSQTSAHQSDHQADIIRCIWFSSNGFTREGSQAGLKLSFQ